MSKAIDDLKKEHEAILAGLKILSAMTTKMEHGLEVERKGIREFIGFLKEFADKCHHGKEESILFPELVGAGIPERDGPVGAMLAEHARGRALVKQMEEATVGAPDYPGFVKAAKEYETLLQTHIQKENEVLFPSAERVLEEPKLNKIFEMFEEHEKRAIGAGRHEELHSMLKALRQKFFV